MKDYVRVSDILAQLQSYSHIDPIVLNAKAEIGTEVHQAIVDDQAGEMVIFSSNRAWAYFESYKMGKFESAIRQVPRLFCDKLMITGECDGLMGSKGSKEILIDWKCSASANLDIWNLQAHFYWYLLQQSGYEVSDKMLWVNLKQKKLSEGVYAPLAPKVHTFTFSETTLLYCIELANKFWEEYSNAKNVD